MPAQKLNRAIKYRAFPTDEQAELFAKTFGCVRLVWNNMLADAQRFYDETGELFITSPAKYKKRFPFLKEVDSMALCNCQLDLKGAYHKAFSEPGVGFPNFKSKKKPNVLIQQISTLARRKTGAVPPLFMLAKTLFAYPKSVT